MKHTENRELTNKRHRKFFSFCRAVALPAAVLAMLSLGSCSSAPTVPEGKFLIEGELENVPDSVVIQLMKDDGNLTKAVTRDTVIQGKFTLCDSVIGTTPQQFYLFCYAKGFPCLMTDVWLNSGSYTKVTGHDCLLPLWNISSDVPEQLASNEFLKLCPAERKRSMQWWAQEGDLFREGKKFGINWQKIDSLRKLRDPLDSLIYLAEMNYMKEAPVTAVWLDKYKLYSSFLQWNTKFGNRELIRSLYDRMSEADKATEPGKEITEYMNLPVTVNVGDDMADGDLYDLDGKTRHLSEFKGKYILLDFWSRGCGPCMQSLPEMELIAQQYNGKMEVVSINQDSEEQWRDIVKKKSLKGNQWNELRRGRTGLAAAYQVVGIPHYVMISPEGKIIAMWSGYGKGSLTKEMKKLIK